MTDLVEDYEIAIGSNVEEDGEPVEGPAPENTEVKNNEVIEENQ